jgi:hypothetical protein
VSVLILYRSNSADSFNNERKAHPMLTKLRQLAMPLRGHIKKDDLAFVGFSNAHGNVPRLRPK